MRSFILAAALASLWVPAALAQAQPIQRPISPDRIQPRPAQPQQPIEPVAPIEKKETVTPPPVRDLPRAPLTLERFTASGRDLRTRSEVVHRGPVVAALAGFELRYSNGAHQIRQIGVMNRGEHIEVNFRDHNGDDPFTFRGEYVAFPGQEHRVRLATVSAPQCGGRCSIRLPAIAPDETALLVGFSFRRPRDDANLEAMAVELLPDRRVADVMFFDDGGFDFSGFAPAPLFEIYTAAESARNEGPGAVAVELQVMIIPRDFVAYMGRMIGVSQMAARTIAPQDLLPDGQSWERVSTRGAIMGFGMMFGNGDHHIERVSVDLTAPPVVEFRDADPDDPMSWYVDYVAFRD